MIFSFAGLAQLVEHLIRNEGVVGSSPITGTTLRVYDATGGKPPIVLYVFIYRITPLVYWTVYTIWAKGFTSISSMQNHYMIDDCMVFFRDYF